MMIMFIFFIVFWTGILAYFLFTMEKEDNNTCSNDKYYDSESKSCKLYCEESC